MIVEISWQDIDNRQQWFDLMERHYINPIIIIVIIIIVFIIIIYIPLSCMKQSVTER